MAQQSSATSTRREKTDRAARRKGCDIRHPPDEIVALHSLQVFAFADGGRASRPSSRAGRPASTQVRITYVGTLRIRYPPARPNNTSGAQAASTGGNWLTFPIDSDRREIMM